MYEESSVFQDMRFLRFQLSILPILPYCLGLAFLAVLASHAFLLPGFPITHESPGPGVINSAHWLLQVDKNVMTGSIPNWCPDEFEAGVPCFNYYPPLAYYVAELFHLCGFMLVDSVKLTFVLSYLLSGLAMFFFISAITHNTVAGLISGIAYEYAPYHFVDSLIRGDLSESFAFVFLPIVFYFACRSTQGSTNNARNAVLGGLFLGLLILTHNITAYIVLLVLCVLALCHSVSIRRPLPLLSLLLAVFVALSVTAYYWIPAFVELKYVNPGVLALGRWEIFYLSLRRMILPFPANWNGQAGWSAGWASGGIESPLTLGTAGLLSLTFCVPIVAWKRTRIVMYFLSTLMLSVLFASEVGWFVVLHLPFGRFVQFGYRFLIIGAFASAALLGLSTKELGHLIGSRGWCSRRRATGVLSLILIFVLLASSHQYLYPPAGYMSAWAANNFRGPDHWEYLPQGARPLGQAIPDVSTNAGEVALVRKTATHWVAASKSSTESNVTFKIYKFPGWRVYVDGAAQEMLTNSSYGLIQVEVPQGYHMIEAVYSDTFPRLLGKIITVFAMLGMIAWQLLISSKRLQGRVSVDV